MQSYRTVTRKPPPHRHTMDQNTTFSNNSSASPYNDGDKTILITVMCFLAVQGCFVVVINALVIYLIAKKHSLRTTTNLCLGSLAISDMMTGLFVIPMIISCNANSYMFGVCLAMDLGNRFLAISTILHLLVITAERYYTIVFSRAALSHCSITIPEALVGLPCLWAFALIASLVQLFWVFDSDEERKLRVTIVYDLIVLSMLVFLPLVIMAVAYGHIFYVVRTQIAKIKRGVRHLSGHTLERHNWKERKALLIYGAMIIVFVIGWFNYFFLTLQDDLQLKGLPTPLWVNIMLLFLKNSTGILNPILYTYLKQDFRKARNTLGLCRKDVRSNSSFVSTNDATSTVVVYQKVLV